MIDIHLDWSAVRKKYLRLTAARVFIGEWLGRTVEIVEGRWLETYMKGFAGRRFEELTQL